MTDEEFERTNKLMKLFFILHGGAAMLSAHYLNPKIGVRHQMDFAEGTLTSLMSPLFALIEGASMGGVGALAGVVYASYVCLAPIVGFMISVSSFSEPIATCPP